jgi:hypothetical protein
MLKHLPYIHILIFWVMTQCRLVRGYQRFGGIYYLHLLKYCSTSTLKVEVGFSSKALIPTMYHTTQRTFGKTIKRIRVFCSGLCLQQPFLHCPVTIWQLIMYLLGKISHFATTRCVPAGSGIRPASLPVGIADSFLWSQQQKNTPSYATFYSPSRHNAFMMLCLAKEKRNGCQGRVVNTSSYLRSLGFLTRIGDQLS